MSQGMNGTEGFVAGSFMHGPSPAAHFPVDEHNYLFDLERHLGRQHQGHTPFISVSETLLRVLYHALRRIRSNHGEPKDWKLAVIQLAAVPSLVKAVWDLDAGEHAPRARGEWVGKNPIFSSIYRSVLIMLMFKSTERYQRRRS